MGVEEGGDPRDDRWNTIWNILWQRQILPRAEEFRPTMAYARFREGGVLGRIAVLHPVAFAAHASVTIRDGEVESESGGMMPYLYLETRYNRFAGVTGMKIVRKSTVNNKVRYSYVRDPFSITDEDLHKMKIAVQCNPHLLEAEFIAVLDEIEHDYKE